MKRPNSCAFVVWEDQKTGRGRALHIAPYTVTAFSYCRFLGATKRCPFIHVFPGFAVT